MIALILEPVKPVLVLETDDHDEGRKSDCAASLHLQSVEPVLALESDDQDEVL